MKKRALSVVLAIILTLTLSVPAFATTYSDLNNHWAKTYMEDLAAKGLLSGFSDGTMRPNNKISTCETLVFLSRLYTLSDTEYQMIKTDYETTVKDIVSPTFSWAYKNIEICLAAGIITKDELKTISLTGDTTREKISVYLVRAIQLTSDAANLAGTKLTFADTAKISANCVGSIAELYKLGIVKGDDSNNFAPQTSVTRAVAATLVYRSLAYLKDNNTSLVIGAYDGASRDAGIITSVSGSNLEIRGYDGLTRVYTVSSDASVTVNKAASALSSVYVGCYTTITAKSGVVLILAIDNDSTVTWVQGAVSSISVTTAISILNVKNLKTGAITSYTIPSTAAITRAGTSVLFSTLQNNDFVTLKFVSGVVAGIYVAPSSSELTGTILSITYGTTITLEIADSNGVEYRYLFDIADLPPIKRGDKVVGIDQLKTGNKITVKFAGSKVASIATVGTGSAVSGVLTSLTMSASGTVWVLTINGTKTSFTVDECASVFNGSTAISLSDVHIGDQVSVVVYDNTITDISLISTTLSSTKMTATILKVDTVNQVITVLTSGNKLAYVKTSAVVSIIIASTGNSTSLSYLTVNSKLTAYGTYSDSKTFTAKSIIIE